MQTWGEAPEVLRRAVEALELVTVEEQLAALRRLAENDGMELAEEVARLLLARKVGRRRVAELSDSQVISRASEVMEGAVASGQLTQDAMAEIMAAGDLRAKLAEFIANGYMRTTPRPDPKLRRILRGDAGPDSADEGAT